MNKTSQTTTTERSRGASDLGLLLVGHGSREDVGVREFLATAAQVRELAGSLPVEPCFLEFAEPTIAQGFHRLMERGVRQVLVVPVLLFAAGHAKRDIPEAVAVVADEFPGVQVRQSKHLGCHEAMLAISRQRYEEALNSVSTNGGSSSAPADASDSTLLVLVGRGSYDPGATGEMLAFARARAEAMGDKSGEKSNPVEVGFVAMAQPRLQQVLDAAGAGPAQCVIVQPHLLFGGVLLEQIGRQVAEYGQRFPHKRWIVTAHLGPSPLVAQAIYARAEELISSEC